MKKSRIASPVPHPESSLRHLPLVDLLVDTKTELLELALRSGLKVFTTTMLEEDRTAICGPRYAHEPERPASRAGTTRREVVLGGRKVTIQRPRVRTTAGEVPLPTFQTMAATDPLDRRVVEQMVVGVATRRCKIHKMRNILEYLNDRQRPWAQAILRRAYQSADVKAAQRLLVDLAKRLETEHPGAAESVREGLDETITVLTLNLSARLRRSLATTNAAESLLSRTRQVKRNVKRWRSGQMMLRWVAAGVLEATRDAARSTRCRW
jgi:transposase-like protein